MDYINAQTVKDKFKTFFENRPVTPQEFEVFVDSIKKEDVQLVIHAKWRRVEDDHCYWYACSVCDTKTPTDDYGNDYYSDYCPCCGAKMDVPMDVIEEAGVYR